MKDKSIITTEEEWTIIVNYKDDIKVYENVIFIEERTMGIRLLFDVNGNHIKYIPLYNVTCVDMKKVK
jgi:hypothetical protein